MLKFILKTGYSLFLAILAGCLFLATVSKAQQFEFTGKRKKEIIPFKMIKNLMVIPLTINGKGPYNFILDTGVGLFIITDHSLIDTLQIKNIRSIKIAGFGEGADISAFVTPAVEVEIASAKAKSMPAAILKEDIFGLSNFAGMPVHGLIGFEFFNSFIVRISYLQNTLTIYRPETAFVPRKGTRIPITIEERKPYVICDLTLSDGLKTPVKLIIDTGAGHPVSLETNLGMPFEVPPINIAGNLGVGLSGPITGYIGRIPSIKLGKYSLNNVIAAFPNYKDVAAKVISINRNGNLGNTILKRFNVVFDYSRQVMYLKPSSLLKEPFEHDMSGMELTSAGADFKRVIVNRIEPFSPAEDAGIMKDDEILSINLKPVADMTLEEINNLLRSKNDRSFVIEIGREKKKQSFRVILTLQRRI
ncbi:MAG: aspartyl protease family protein [Daejeonella sp.]